MLEEVLKIGIAFGSVFSWVLVLSILVRDPSHFSPRYTIILLVSGGFVQLYAYLNMNGLYSSWGFVNYLYIPFLILMGPATWLHFYDLLHEDFEVSKLRHLAFAPGVILFIGLPTVELSGLLPIERSPVAYFESGDLHLLEYLFLAALIYNTFFYIQIYRGTHLVFSFKRTPNKKAGFAFISIYFMLIVLVILAVLSMLLREPILLWIVVFMVAVLAVMAFLFVQGYQDFYYSVESAVQKAKYRVSQIQGLDLSHVQGRLEKLMSDDELFLDEDLTLSKLASRLDLKTYQLSEFLNQHLQTNFAQFVNSYRVKRAADMLLATPQANILSIAYNVGFNSKATFNLAFKKLYGVSPRDFVRNSTTAGDSSATSSA